MGLVFAFFFAASSAIFCRTSLSFRAVETAGRFAQHEEFSTKTPSEEPVPEGGGTQRSPLYPIKHRY